MTASRHSKIVIVEDEETVREGVRFALYQQGYDVEGFDDGQAAWEALDRDLPDLVILDIMLPKMDGLEICRRLRAKSEAVPIIFLTSREEEFDRVLGLEIGADDYMCKPFSMRELMARVKVLLRRAAMSPPPPGADHLLTLGPLTLDSDRYVVAWKGAPVPVTVTEFLMLRALVRHPGHVKTRTQLMEEAYGDHTFVSDRTIDSHVKRLRRKLASSDPECDVIETVYGLGYRCRSHD